MQGPQGAGVPGPEPAPGATHVPVGQVVDEGGQQLAGALGVEVLQGIGDLAHQHIRRADQPAIQDVARVDGGRDDLTGRPVVGTGVQGVERHRVPVGEQHLAHGLLQRLVPHATGAPRRSVGGHEPAQGVGTVSVHEGDGQQDVAQVLAHLAPIGSEDVAQAQHVAVR